jgi:hypothetical protein
MAALLALENHETFHMERHTKGTDSGDVEAIQVTSQAIRDVFEVEDYDPEKETGLCLGEQLGLFALFMAYLEAIKKNGSFSPTSPQSTEESTSSESSEPTTSDTVPSGSTCGEATSDQPTE